MKYAINLAEDGRILSATYPQYSHEDAVIVDSLPEGDIADFLYVDGKFVFDPLPEPERPKQEETTDDVLNALLGVTV